MKSRNFTRPKAYARQLLKDLKSVVEFERQLGLSLPVVETAFERYETYVNQGNEMQDSASVVRLYEGSQS
jgi:3-hydroxyisobutyrate dehydrogenase